MLSGTKKLFPKEYDNFKSAMIKAAEESDLPIVLELKQLKDFTLNDIQDLFYEFKRDTSLEISGSLYMDDTSCKLHLMLEVNYSQENNNTILQ